MYPNRYLRLIFATSIFVIFNPGVLGTGTVSPMKPFDLQQVTNQMIDVIKKKDYSRKDANAILSKLVYSQRMQLADAYEDAVRTNLIDDLNQDEKVTYRRLINALFSSKEEIHVRDLTRAIIDGSSTLESIVEICAKSTASKDAKKNLKNLYRKFNELYSLDQLINDYEGDDTKHALLEIISTNRYRDPPAKNTDDKLADSTAQTLLDKLGGIEDHRQELDTFLIQTNFPQLHLTLDKFKDKNKGKPLEQTLKDKLDDDKKVIYVGLCNYVTDYVTYMAIRMKESFHYDDRPAVIRIIVVESELNLVEIKAKYKEMYGNTISKTLSDSFADPEKSLLLQILGPD